MPRFLIDVNMGHDRSSDHSNHPDLSSFPPECLGERCDSARSRIASARSRSTRTTPIKHCAARMRKVYMERPCGAARLLATQLDMVRQQQVLRRRDHGL
jgi:hypothetical protein